MPYNLEAIKKLFQEYYILDYPKFAGALTHRIKAEPQHHQAIIDSGYIWDENKLVYTDPRLGAIVALPNDMFIWMIGQFGKVLKNSDKLNIWVNGRNEEFISKLMSASGQGDNDIKFSGAGERSKPYNPTPKPQGDETDQLISKLKKQAGKDGTLPSDLMINLGLTAKKENNERLLAFLKTVKPMNENTIKRSKLNTLIREIVKGIIKEGFPSDMGKRHEDEVVLNYANQVWGKQRWTIKRRKTGEQGTVYQLSSSNIPNTFLWKTPDGRWKALNIKIKKWIDVQPVQEMTGTGAVSPVMTPNAFKKRGPMEEGKIQDPTKEEMLNYLRSQFGNEEGFEDDAEAAMYWFATFNYQGQGSNLYSVLSTSYFTPGPIRNGPLPDSAEDMMFQSLEHEFGNPDQRVDEMTTTGDVSGYNIPAAFSRRGGSEKGVKGSESLGYTLTPQGKKEMNRKADKLTEKKELDDAS